MNLFLVKRPVPLRWIAVAVFVIIVVFLTLWGKGMFPFNKKSVLTVTTVTTPAPPASAPPKAPASAILPPPVAASAATKSTTSSVSTTVSVKTETKAEPKKSKVAKTEKKTARKSSKSKPVVQAVQEQQAVEPGVSGGFRWVHFGTAPYASSREEAMRTRERAFRTMGLPSPLVTQLVFATDLPGEKTRISVGDHLDVMLSKGGAAHKNVTVAFAAPVRGMEYAAPAEKWTVAWEGKTYTILLPEVCNNWSIVIGVAPLAPLQAAAVPVRPSPPVATSASCPEGWVLIANAWSLSSLPAQLRQEAETLIAAANARDSDNARRLEPYKPDDVSRTLGKRLREQVRTRAPYTGDVAVRFIDPKTAQVVRDLGTIRLTDGVGEFRFSEDPRKYVVETLWPLSFVSPATSAGRPRLRLFGYEWTGICAMNEHGLR